MITIPTTFHAVAPRLAEMRWRPFPGHQRTKIPAMRRWNDLNTMEWEDTDLLAAVSEYQPVEAFCCCLAVQPEIVVLDLDITDAAQSAFAVGLADDVLEKTPLTRIGLAPKAVRIYRSSGGIKSRKTCPLEIFSGTGQVVAFGWHEGARRPYIWPQASPLELDASSAEIPLVAQSQMDHFIAELFKVVPRRALLTRGPHSGIGAPQTIGDRLRMLTMLYGSWRYAAVTVLSEAMEGNRNETGWVVVASAAARGIPEDVVWQLFERHFAGWDGFSPSDLASAIERSRRKPPPSDRPFGVPLILGGRNVF